MTRTKWLKIRLPRLLESLGGELRAHPYSVHTNSGFELIQGAKRELRARHIQQIFQTETLMDPFGNSVARDSVTWICTEFWIHHMHTDSFLLVIFSPPRSLRCFFRDLAAAAGFGFVMGSVSWDLRNLRALIREQMVAVAVRVHKLSASGVVISPHSSCKVEVISDRDALEEYAEHFAKGGGKLEKIFVSVAGREGLHQLEISRSGSVGCSDEMIAPMINLLGKHWDAFVEG